MEENYQPADSQTPETRTNEVKQIYCWNYGEQSAYDNAC